MRSRQELEQAVWNGLTQAGEALIEIRDRGLYRETHEDFQSYCRDVFGFSAGQIASRIETAQIAATVEDNLEHQSHARQLARIADLDLRNMAWNEAKVLFRGDITASKLSQVVSKYAIIEDQTLLDLIKRQVITATQASDLVEVASKLPKYWQEALKQFGISAEGCVHPEAVRILRVMEYTEPDEIRDVLMSGVVYINYEGIPLWQLTADMAKYFQKVIYARYKETQQQLASDKQQSDRIVSGDNYVSLFDAPRDELVWFFPNGMNMETLTNILRSTGMDTFAVVLYKGDPKIDFDGESVSVKKTPVLPKKLIRLIEGL